MLEELGAGWTASFLAKVCPSLSRYLIREFSKAVTELSIVVIPALFVSFGAENVCERTSGTAHRGSTEPTAGRTLDANCDHIWELVRADELEPLPRENERKFEKVQYEKIHRLLD